MPITRFLQSLSGTCRHCSQQTGFLQRTHPKCRQTHQAGVQEIPARRSGCRCQHLIPASDHYYSGLSPRVRGHRFHKFLPLDCVGSIPACAGAPP